MFKNSNLAYFILQNLATHASNDGSTSHLSYMFDLEPTKTGVPSPECSEIVRCDFGHQKFSKIVIK